jgi:NAD(P)-dependent dehydrogenase (short-subunit alcohol dehydrogenase family)
MLILVTGPTRKVGRTFIDRLLADPHHAGARVRALCHNRTLAERERVEVVRGSIADRAAVEAAMAGVTHVVHLATCQEMPELVMDVMPICRAHSPSGRRAVRSWSICPKRRTTTCGRPPERRPPRSGVGRSRMEVRE